MIGFLLQFALGFLAAALIALLLAPVIHRRIVTLTERRMRASVPLSAAEVKAEKDFARAAFAAEKAKLAVDLRSERDRTSVQLKKNIRLEEKLAEAREEVLALTQKNSEASEQAGQLRSQIRERDTRLETLTGEAAKATREVKERSSEIDNLRHQINRLEGGIEEMKIDVATRDTEIENFKSQIQALRDERARLRDDLRSRTASGREAEIRLKQETERANDLDARLAKAIATLSDREQSLENRSAEVARLQEEKARLSIDLKEVTDDLKAAEKQRKALEKDIAKAEAASERERKANERAVAKAEAQAEKDATRDAASVTPIRKSQGTPEAEASENRPARPQADNMRPAERTSPAKGKLREADEARSDEELIEHLRLRQTALAEQLKKADKPGGDAALRNEIAEIAALMIDLTVRRDGKNGPITRILSGNEDQIDGAGMSLAARARARMEASSN
ncbi:hypothetical protein E2A64_15655 [Pseudohoeflea suaedae]|uniref:Uncharacterized protein n=1 Tax=Pseudohoeflea suaedae TaxID=877384 RepID=A0A4R5PIR7_9HYPH|nr:hypothetical protein [Pseudohoeflea suaedae]TDH35143.1 hypothetical protein E2A64_15655 [Pseudohoeflea suaedae]